MYAIEFTAKALREYASLPAQIRKTIKAKLERLAIAPNKSQHVKALQGVDAYRLRVGDYRIVYVLHNDALIITVIRVAHRKEVYQ
jgi:mRNA interferase RelE/StbE